jgi:hypothetical protein
MRTQQALLRVMGMTGGHPLLHVCLCPVLLSVLADVAAGRTPASKLMKMAEVSPLLKKNPLLPASLGFALL